MLVAYAGKDSEPATDNRQARAYERFMVGADTLQIAEFYRVSEAIALRWVTLERSLRHNLPSPCGFRR